MHGPVDPNSRPYPPARRAWYAVAILTVAYILSFIDRQILSLLVVPIRRDLHITDTQMSLLMGLSFAVFYSFFGIPLGRLADSRSRRNIITWGILAWSFCTAGCGVISSYTQLFLMRVGVGVGEAALSPPAYSMVSDYFAAHRRAMALSVYGLGIFIGAGLAMILGGAIVAHTTVSSMIVLPLVGLSVFPWQLTFFVVGIPGLLIAAIMRTVHEPERRERAGVSAPSILETHRYIFRHRATFACHHLAASTMSIVLYGSLAWIPTFLIRDHGLSANHAGLIYGSEVAIFSSFGVLAGGWLCDFLARRGHSDAHFRVGLIVCLLNLVPAALFPLMRSSQGTFILIAPFTFLMATTYGVAPAALQQVVPNEMRAQMGAVYLFVVNIIGLAAGPTAIALVTDHVFHNDNAIRYSLLIVFTGAYAASALLWWAGMKPYRRTLEQAAASVVVAA
jgi:MFS family permease